MSAGISDDLLKHMRVPENQWKVTLDAIPKSCLHRSYVVAYLSNMPYNLTKPAGLYLFGDYGQGKSGIAALCLIEAAKLRKIGLWTNARDLPTFMDERQGVMFNEYVTMRERICEVPLLVIDEMMTAEDKYGNSPVIDAAEAIVRIRQDARLPVILTSNEDPRELKNKAPHMTAILKESVTTLTVGGHNFRDKLMDDLVKAVSGSKKEEERY